MQAVNSTEVRNHTQQIIDGPLKHIRAAALAAALVPLASVVATPASARTAGACAAASAGVCGTVFNDTNNNGVQDAGETGIEGVKVSACLLCDGTDTFSTWSGLDGGFSILDI